mgnify:CR=1 FL=1
MLLKGFQDGLHRQLGPDAAHNYAAAAVYGLTVSRRLRLTFAQGLYCLGQPIQGDVVPCGRDRPGIRGTTRAAAGAEGATASETLRQKDRREDGTLESRQRARAPRPRSWASPTRKAAGTAARKGHGSGGESFRYGDRGGVPVPRWCRSPGFRPQGVPGTSGAVSWSEFVGGRGDPCRPQFRTAAELRAARSLDRYR